ncbi:MAG: AAA family ATPase [Prevotellaceae bacterium]|nr:AAA family ATPase [Prevotellaceae bacterium]
MESLKNLREDIIKEAEKMEAEMELITPSGLNTEDYRVDPSVDYERPECILVQEETGAPIMTKGGLSLVLGPPKSRKTSLCVALTASLLGKPMLGLRCADEADADNMRIVFFDTEQGKGYAQLTCRKMYKLLDWDTAEKHDRLVYYDLRPLTKEERLEVVVKAIERFKPTVIFIDGIVDMCKDYNEQSGCGEIMDQLLKLSGTYQSHICSCLHTNKDGRTERGVLGAMLKQKGENTLFIRGYKGYSWVEPLDDGCRQKPFSPFAFTLSEDSALPIPWTGDTTEAQQETSLRKIMHYTEAAFSNSGRAELSNKELQTAIMEEAKDNSEVGLSRNNLFRYIAKMVDINFLRKVSRGVYALTTDETLQQELTFDDNSEELLS